MSDDVLIKNPRPLEPHLVGTEKEWFPAKPEDCRGAGSQRPAAREKSVDAMNEEQYRLHKMHDEKKKQHKDTCDDRFCKGRGPVSVRTKQDYEHHYDAFWFGALPEKSEAARSTGRKSVVSNPLQDEGSYSRGRKSISRANNSTCHQQEKLTGLKEMQDCDRTHSGRIRKRLFQGHNAMRVESLQATQDPVPRQPYHFDPPFGITRVGYAKENMTPRHTVSTPWADDYTGCSVPTSSARQVLAARRNPLAETQPLSFQSPPSAGYARPQAVRNRKDLL